MYRNEVNINKDFKTVCTEDLLEQFHVPLQGFVKRKVASDSDAHDIDSIYSAQYVASYMIESVK
jgi:hypothetical protein